MRNRMKELKKSHKIQVRVLGVLLLVLLGVAGEVWMDKKNSNDFKKVTSYLKVESDLKENEEYFLMAVKEKKYNIIQVMLDGRMQEPMLFDFIYMGNGLGQILNSENKTDIEVENLEKKYVDSWNKWKSKVISEKESALNLQKINCELSLYCRHKKQELNKEVMKSKVLSKEMVDRKVQLIAKDLGQNI